MFSSIRPPASRLLLALTFLVAAIPAWCALSWVLHYGVDVPTKDDWDTAAVVVKAHTGQLTFADLFQQQQEGRTVLPKLIFILFSVGGHWQIHGLMMLSIGICAATAAGLYLLLRRTGFGAGGAAACWWIFALLIFSAAQFEVWLWAWGFPSFMPALFLVAALLAVETKISAGAKFFLCALCATASSFTLPHGLLLWGLTFPVALLGRQSTNWKRWLVGWIFATVLCAGIYFHGYAKPTDLPEFAPAVSLLDYACYFLAFLGDQFAFASASAENRPALAITAGAILCAIFLAALIYTFARRRDEIFLRRALPWIALGGYAIGSDTLAMLGRIGFGINSALSSRYVPFSLYLTIGAVALAGLIARQLWESRRSFKLALALGGCCLLAAGAFGTLAKISTDRCVQFMQGDWANTRLLHGAVLFSQALDVSGALRNANNPSLEFVRSNARDLDELKLLRPRLVRSPGIDALAVRANPAVATGKLETMEILPNEQARASGFAALLAKGRPADAVVLAYETPAKQWQAFALSDSVSKRPEVARELRSRQQRLSGWSATFPRTSLPAGAKISAWALDAEIPKLYRLAGPPDEPAR